MSVTAEAQELSEQPESDARPMKRKFSTFLGLLVIHLGALGAFVPALFSWRSVGLAALFWYLTGGVGITLCFHRILTHRSLKVPQWLEYLVALIGTLALQGGPIDWVATHRKHHAFSDREGDPHSPNEGMWWAHAEWLYGMGKERLEDSEFARWAPDLVKDPVYRFLQAYPVPIQVAFGFLCLAIGGWSLVVWGVFARLVFTYHATWFVNSAAHAFGYQSYRSNDLSTNCWWVALFAFGEGWHNNHHAFPFSARHGLKWYEIDITWLLIKLLAALGLAKNIKLPTPEMLKRLQLEKKPQILSVQ